MIEADKGKKGQALLIAIDVREGVDGVAAWREN